MNIGSSPNSMYAVFDLIYGALIGMGAVIAFALALCAIALFWHVMSNVAYAAGECAGRVEVRMSEVLYKYRVGIWTTIIGLVILFFIIIGSTL